MCQSPCRSFLDIRFQSDFCLILALYTKSPAFYADIFPPSSFVTVTCVLVLCRLSLFVALESVRVMHKWEGVGGAQPCWQRKILRGCACKIIMVRNLLRQSEAHSQVPVRILVLVLQGTEEAISTDNVGVWPRDRYWNLDVNPATHVRIGFLHFHCHESTQTCKYDQVLFSKHSINRKNKLRKMVPLLVAVINVNILLLILPTSQELIHWFVLVGIRVWVSKSDINVGISLDFP